MDLGDVYINIKVRKVDLPDDLVEFVNSGVKVVEELKKCREEIKRLESQIRRVDWNEFLHKIEIRDLGNKVEKLEGDIEYYKNSGYFQYPVITCDFDPIINLEDINTSIAEGIFKK